MITGGVTVPAHSNVFRCPLRDGPPPRAIQIPRCPLRAASMAAHPPNRLSVAPMRRRPRAASMAAQTSKRRGAVPINRNRRHKPTNARVSVQGPSRRNNGVATRGALPGRARFCYSLKHARWYAVD